MIGHVLQSVMFPPPLLSRLPCNSRRVRFLALLVARADLLGVGAVGPPVNCESMMLGLRIGHRPSGPAPRPLLAFVVFQSDSSMTAASSRDAWSGRGPAVALGHQVRQPANVVLVRVGHENGIDVLGPKCKAGISSGGHRILGIGVECSAVDQATDRSRVKQRE